MTTRYEQGRGFAYRVSRKLATEGYFVIRSAGSKTKVDIIAFKKGDIFGSELLFVQAKKSTDGTIPPEERAELIRLADLAEAFPLVAYQPKPRGPIAYRRLTGPGPKQFTPWTPDHAMED